MTRKLLAVTELDRCAPVADRFLCCLQLREVLAGYHDPDPAGDLLLARVLFDGLYESVHDVDHRRRRAGVKARVA